MSNLLSSCLEMENPPVNLYSTPASAKKIVRELSLPLYPVGLSSMVIWPSIVISGEITMPMGSRVTSL